MITQQSIGCKLDYDVLEALKAEAAASGKKSNRIINDAIVMYMRWADMCRRIQCGSAANLEIYEYYQEHKDICRQYFSPQL